MNLRKINLMDNLSTRQAFGESLFEIMKNDERVVALTADLGESLRMLKIRDEFPERFLDVGVAEANMTGVAAGLAMSGFVPVAGTFAVFMTRAFDHIRMQICQNSLHAIMVGSHGGVSNAADGGSAHALEDIAYMRALPNMTVVFPADYYEMKQALPVLINSEGPVYLRMYREPTVVFTGEKDDFVLGKAKILRQGGDLTIVATGPQAGFALEASKQLEKEGVETEVISIHTIKPLDKDAIINSAKKTGSVLTVEDHNINGGLGSAVAEVLCEQCPTKLKRLGVSNFGESGAYSELVKMFGIDTTGITEAARSMIEKK